MRNLSRAGLFLALILTAVGCGKGKEHHVAEPSNSSSVEVKTVEVRTENQKKFQEVVGTVEAKLRAVIEAKTSGRVEAMPARLGQKVEKGDLLVELDAGESQARLDQALATREQAEIDLKRMRTLLDQQAVTRAEFDATNTRFRVAEAGVREAETLLRYRRVVAPFSGVVVRKLADVGDLAVPGKPLLELEDPNALRFVANIPDTMVGSLQMGAEVKVQFGDQHRSAKVAEVGPTGDPVSRTSRVEFDLAASDVRSGSFGRVLIPSETASTIVVPRAAVIDRGQMELVFVVRSGQAELRLVRTGKRFENAVEILAGLSEGERIVVENAGKLRDGQPVITR